MTVYFDTNTRGVCRPMLGRRVGVTGLVVGLILGLVLSGCANNSYGRFGLSQEVETAFESGHAFPDYNYFYAGRQSMPHAVIGIDKAYQVPSKLWKAFTPTPAELTRMANHILRVHNEQPYGAEILSPSRQRIGVWYSRIVAVHVEVDEANKSVSIVFVDPENDGGGKHPI
jgi:hypothetical protein